MRVEGGTGDRAAQIECGHVSPGNLIGGHRKAKLEEEEKTLTAVVPPPVKRPHGRIGTEEHLYLYFRTVWLLAIWER